MLEWISLQDKWPEPNKNVLVVFNKSICVASHDGYRYPSWSHFPIGQYAIDGYIFSDVTHWMPLNENKELFKKPTPKGIIHIFSSKNLIPLNVGATMEFKRYNLTKTQRIDSQNTYIEKLKEKLRIAEDDLIKIEDEDD